MNTFSWIYRSSWVPPRRKYRTAAATRERSRFLIASTVAIWGAQIGHVAIPLTAVTALGTDTTGTSLIVTLLSAPFVMLGLPVGAWLDRVRRRPVMISADLVRCLTLVTVPVAWWFEMLTMTHLLVAVLVQGTATVFFDLAAQSFVKDIAPGRDLVRTNSRLATATQSALICAPPLAGWLAGLLTAPTVLLVMAGGYLWSAVWLASLRTPEQPQEHPSPRRLGSEIVSGLRHVGGDAVLRTVLLAGCMVNIGTAAVMSVLPVLALSHLGWAEADLGLFLGAGGAGGLCGALVATRLADALGAGRAVLVVGILVAPLAASLPLLGAPVPPLVAAGAWALVVFKVGFDSVLMMTFRQQVTPSGLLGRVNGTMRVFFSGAVMLGAALAGSLAALIGVRGALWMAALVLAAVWVPIALSPVRTMTVLGERT